MDMVKELVGDLEASSSEVASLMHELDESSDGEKDVNGMEERFYL